jgi:hypothetical protein
MVQQAPPADRLRAVLDTVFAGPGYRWADVPWPLRMLRQGWDRVGEWLRGLRADNPVIFRFLTIALLTLLLLTLAHALYVVWRTLRLPEAEPGAGAVPLAREPRDSAWYYRRADRAASEGRMAEALQLAFVGLALTLDAQGLLRYHESKTPAECARDAQIVPHDRQRLRAMVRSLYAHAFGGRPCAADDYRRWREAGEEPWHAAAS